MKQIILFLVLFYSVLQAQPDGRVFTTRQDTTLKGVVRDSLNVRIPFITAAQVGLKGDGVTDDTDSLLAVLSGSLANGGRLLLATGTYILSGDITIPQGVTIEGMALNLFAASGVVFQFNDNGGIRMPNTRSILKNVSIVTADTAIYVTGIQSEVENVEVMGGITVTDIGVMLYDAIYNKFTNVRVNQCLTGLQLGIDNPPDNDNAQLNLFERCSFNNNSVAGADIRISRMNTFLQCGFEGNPSWGLISDAILSDSTNWSSDYLTNVNSGNTFINCWWESNEDGNIWLKTDAGSVFQNCEMLNILYSPEYLIKLEFAVNTRFENIYITDDSLDAGIDIASSCYGISISTRNEKIVRINDRGINTTIAGLPKVKSDLYDYTPNQAFNLTDAIFQSWSENTGSGSGTWSKDSIDLFYPKSVTGYSAKLTMGASPSATPSISVTGTKVLDSDSTYYAVIVYKNDSADSIGYTSLDFLILNADLNTVYNTGKGRWVAIADGQRISLPMSSKINKVVIPITGYDQAVILALYGYYVGNANAVHHIYSCYITKHPDNEPIGNDYFETGIDTFDIVGSFYADSTGYLSKTSPTGINFTTSEDFTLNAWFNTKYIDSTQRIVSYRNGTNGYELFLESGILGFLLGDGTSFTVLQDNSTINDSTWYLATIRYTASSGVLQMLINGVLSNGTTQALGAINPSSNLYIGRYAPSDVNRFRGEIGEILLAKDFVISDAQALVNYNNGIGGVHLTDQGTKVFWYKFLNDYTDELGTNDLTLTGVDSIKTYPLGYGQATTNNDITITLGIPHTDATYGVYLSNEADSRLWITDKTTTGFKIKCSNITEEFPVTWKILR